MPRTNLSKAVVAEKERNSVIEDRLSKLEATGPLVKVPNSSFSVDLLTGRVYLDETILKQIRFQHKYSVDTE